MGALGALVGSLHLNSLEVLLAGPTPAPFSAMTRNSYSLPSVRLVTRCLSSVMVLLEETFTRRRLFFSLLSRMYCLISLPPSDLGLFQHKVMLLPVTWVASGVLGASGTAEEDSIKVIKVIYDFDIFCKHFSCQCSSARDQGYVFKVSSAYRTDNNC